MRARSILPVLFALLFHPGVAFSQQASAPALDFSGIMFGHWRMHTDSANRAATGGKRPNRFDLARVYLNFRMPAGERGSIRATTDILQTTAGGYYGGWTVRMKYAYFQYDATRALLGVDGLAANAKVGMIQNVIIDHVDSFWPRWMGVDAVEQHGFFASADLGVGSTVTLPGRRGEAYVTIMNGSGYTAPESDRFKDIAARFSWTPFAGDSGMFRTLAITPWYSIGRGGGNFAAGGPGQVGPGANGAVTEGVQRDRRGVFIGLRDRRFTGGFDVAQRLDELESGLNTAVTPRVVRDRTSTLLSAFALVRPLELADKSKRSRLTLFGRYDNFHLDGPASVTPPVTDSRTTMAWGGILFDLNARSTFTIDFQQMQAKTTTTNGTTTTSVTVPTKTLFLHWVVTY